jgi:hypothetical protein
VFSSSGTVLGGSAGHRVPDAVASDAPTFVTWYTLFHGEPTDIPEDFLASDVVVTVPEHASHIIIGVPDLFYADNLDSDGDFGVRLVVMPSS